MDGSPNGDPLARSDVILRAEAVARDTDCVRRIAAEIGDAPLSLVALFVSPEGDFGRIMRDAARAFGGVTVIGCTTAGELGGLGYTEGSVVAIGFPARHFVSDSVLIPRLSRLDAPELVPRMIRTRARLTSERPQWRTEFGFLLVDGLSLMEDRLAAACADALGPIPLFGGSAGDGTRFLETAVSMNGQVYTDAAVLTYLRSDCRVEVFSLDHLQPTGRRMVVTRADPARRVVQEINAEPAAREYARLLGKDPEQLDTFTFAAHPVVVRIGGKHHVRAIQKVTRDGELIFFSAIEEGLVLTLADPEPMTRHLERELARLEAAGSLGAVIACDCILRRMEAQQKQMSRQISDILARHRVTGFSTYGEQFGPLHVNQTMTGVAIYRPDGDGA